MTDYTTRLGPIAVDGLQPGDRFSIPMENDFHLPVVVRDAYVSSADPDTVRLVLDVPRYWHSGRIPMRLPSVFREGDLNEASPS